MAQQADLLGIGEDDDALVGVQPAELLSDDELEPVSDNKGFAPVWKVGMEVEVYSRSKDRWIAAIVRKIMSENGIDWVQNSIRVSANQEKHTRGDSDDIRMPLIDSDELCTNGSEGHREANRLLKTSISNPSGSSLPVSPQNQDRETTLLKHYILRSIKIGMENQAEEGDVNPKLSV
eukprot:390252-Amorphochlora_amoeboformis.AAC.1